MQYNAIVNNIKDSVIEIVADSDRIEQVFVNKVILY